ncbi:MAG: ArgE/DapE family deacylase [Desulfobacteraceae bacterium]
MANDDSLKQVIDQVNKNFEDQLQFLSELVRFPSVVGREADAQKFYADACTKEGLAVELFEAEKERVQNHPAYIESGFDFSGRPNIIATLKGTGKGRSLILNGHMDVVSPEPVDSWSVDPWGGEIIENRLYGRGSLDMKAGVSANLFAMKALMDCGLELAGDVILESVIEEELGGGGGTLACFLRGITADGMLISEPSRQFVWITHPGIKYFRIKILGKPAHAALSHTGVNAIVKMVPVIQALEQLDQKRAATLSYPKVEEQTGRSCNLSIGTMAAGDWVSTVAGWATLECRVGFVPGETGDEVKAQVENTITEAVTGDQWLEEHPPQVEWFGWNAEPWVEREDSAFLKTFADTCTQVLGIKPKLTGASGGLDTRFGTMFDTPSLSFGPDGANYHGIDEYVDIATLREVTQTLATFIPKWCGLA